jgi:hypothetical protein
MCGNRNVWESVGRGDVWERGGVGESRRGRGEAWEMGGRGRGEAVGKKAAGRSHAEVLGVPPSAARVCLCFTTPQGHGIALRGGQLSLRAKTAQGSEDPPGDRDHFYFECANSRIRSCPASRLRTRPPDGTIAALEPPPHTALKPGQWVLVDTG